MNTSLRVCALFVALITVALWFFGGFNLGRTRVFVPVEHPAANNTSIVIEESRFLPGLDFVAAGLSTSLLLLVLARRARHSTRSVKTGS